MALEPDEAENLYSRSKPPIDLLKYEIELLTAAACRTQTQLIRDHFIRFRLDSTRVLLADHTPQLAGKSTTNQVGYFH